jgi:UDP-N-acetylmuramate dehydrogenase
MSLDNNLIKKFGNNLSENVNLSNYSWFNLGGKAEYLFKAKDKNQLLEFLKEAKQQNLMITILGAGSNTLIRDNGVKGAVVKLGKNFSFTKLIDKNIIEVGAATLDRNVANFAKENNLSNFEFLSCIPGSIGGAIVMNSGCYDDDISKILISIKAIDKNKLTEIEIKKEDIKFSYRGSNLSENLIFISAKFKGSFDKKDKIEKKQLALIEKKKNHSQVKLKLAGVPLRTLVKIKRHGC